MKKPSLFIYLLCFLITQKVEGQGPPAIQWTHKYGGPYDDFCNQIISTSDGNFVAIGTTESISGDVHGHHGLAGDGDFWIMKFDSLGVFLWSKSLGGTYYETGNSVAETFDHGFIITGTTYSNDGDVSGLTGANGAPGGYDDMWVVKTDSLGQIQWQHCFGSTDIDFGKFISQTSDSGFILMGEADYGDSDITNFHGGSDWWVAKLNSTGVIQWRHCLGGGGYEYAQSFSLLNDGSILFVGERTSSGGNVACSSLDGNLWVVKMDAAGSILWQQCFGGSGDENGYQIVPISDGSFYIGATTDSNDGDASGNHGLYDFWILHCDSLGNLLWQNCFGTIKDDLLRSIAVGSDGGILACGYTRTFINLPNRFYSDDMLLVKIDSMGAEEWQQFYGGSLDDFGSWVIPTRDHSYLVAGNSNSVDGDITNYRGAQDFWMTKLLPPSVGIQELGNTTFTQTNCSLLDQTLSINFENKLSEEVSITLTDLLGRTCFTTKVKTTQGKNQFEYRVNLPTEIYLLQLQSKNGLLTRKIY